MVFLAVYYRFDFCFSSSRASPQPGVADRCPVCLGAALLPCLRGAVHSGGEEYVPENHAVLFQLHPIRVSGPRAPCPHPKHRGRVHLRGLTLSSPDGGHLPLPALPFPPDLPSRRRGLVKFPPDTPLSTASDGPSLGVSSLAWLTRGLDQSLRWGLSWALWAG